jgi:hypothetical protein
MSFLEKIILVIVALWSASAQKLEHFQNFAKSKTFLQITISLRLNPIIWKTEETPNATCRLRQRLT